MPIMVPKQNLRTHLDQEKYKKRNQGHLKKILEGCLQEEWTWRLHVENEMGQAISKIECVLEGVNVLAYLPRTAGCQ